MSMISLAVAPSGFDVRMGGFNFKASLLLSCIGLVASFSLMIAGVDLSAAAV